MTVATWDLLCHPQSASSSPPPHSSTWVRLCTSVPYRGTQIAAGRSDEGDEEEDKLGYEDNEETNGILKFLGFLSSICTGNVCEEISSSKAP